MYKKILVPIDFSPCSYNALEYAMWFAQKNHSKIVLLHAYHIPIPVAEMEVYIDVNRVANFEKETQEKIDELVQTYPQLDQLLAEQHTKAAFAIEAINKQVAESDCDFIIMGTHGATNTFDELVGSNTLHTIKQCEVPVLAIPAEYEPAEIQNILFAFDYKPLESREDLLPLIEFTQSNGAQMHVVHITDRLDRLHESEIGEAKILEQHLKGIPHRYHMLEANHIEDGLMEYINTHNIEVIAVMPRKHSVWEKLFKSSISKQLVHHSNIPILAFHHQE